ncbi:YppE family protein [Rossellomorea sp. SC111]|uniref:YppE family protein n=1 Tax=Rossellomorea sp. SC111 TaxID=2968985 RepID=UPI00215B2E9C|nr:YppE family protein [Rossellomorea sp. SC111]MCR8846901.1 YppE family protein [Rossellomorea sp. SC111]
MNELKQVTEELLVLVEKMMNEYKSRRESGEKGEFYTEVKPFADEVKEKNDRWKDLSLNWIKDCKPKHIHFPQIVNTFDNIEMLSVHCFFPESSYNRFISHYQSVSYVLGTELDELKEK